MSEESARGETIQSESCLEAARRCGCDRTPLHLRRVRLHLSARDLFDLMQLREREKDFRIE